MKKVCLLSILMSAYLIICGCGNKGTDIQNSEYKAEEINLMGESENWVVSSYQISLTSDELAFGNGTLDMKGGSEYQTNFFQFKVYAVINAIDTLVQSNIVSVTGGETDVSQNNIGTIKRDAPLNKDGETISIDDISDVYMTIEWNDITNNMKVTERIDLK